MNKIIYTFATPQDESEIQHVLTICQLPSEGIRPHLHNFILAKSNNTLIGVVGIEIYGCTGLIRSLAVLPAERGKGIGKELYIRIIAHAHSQKVNEFYLLTCTAERFFAKQGFQKINRNLTPSILHSTLEFTSLCPNFATCMVMQTGDKAIYYPQEILHLKQDVPGAQMWGVALDKTLLTYFEVEPNCRFERHTHESEQITMVLEGKLFFELDNETFCVKQGEVIAIPSNIPHTVFTEEGFCKAIDAWSPVMPQYRRPNQV